MTGSWSLKLDQCKLTLDSEVTKNVGGGLDGKVVKGDANRDRTMGNHIEVTFKAASDELVFIAEGDL